MSKPTKSHNSPVSKGPGRPSRRGTSHDISREAVAKAGTQQAATDLVPVAVAPTAELAPVERDAQLLAALDGTRAAFDQAERCCLGSRRLQELRSLLTRAEAEQEVTSLEADGALERSVCLGQLIETIKAQLEVR